MTLVTYSESEESDTSLAPVLNPANDKQTPNTSFRKFVSSDGHKVKVELASSQQTSDHSQRTTADSPSPKKRRLDAPASSKGFNALLPPPKHVNTESTSFEKKVSQSAVGSNFSLKTASEPAFDRKLSLSTTTSDEEAMVLNRRISGTYHDIAIDRNGITKAGEPLITTSEITGNQSEAISSSKPAIFKPLSVARKASSRRRTGNVIANRSEAKLSSERMINHRPNSAIESKKISLFSMDNTDAYAICDTANMDYKENLSGDMPGQVKEFNEGTVMTSWSTLQDSATSSSLNRAEISKTSLLAIAEDLNLPESAKRQLLGRNRSKNGNMSDLSAINVVNFNTDHEYSANEELRAAGETIQHNPVRSIAPGKHSLRQLVSSATTQKDALEEHFATGRRNRKEAGGKYGW